MSVSDLSGISVGDILTFLAVTRHNSLSGAAREMDVTPSQVSKAIVRLEKQLKAVLLNRGGRGVVLSDAGQRAVPLLNEVVSKLRELRHEHKAQRPELTLAAPSYLLSAFLPKAAAMLPALRLRGLELPPSLLRAYAGDNFYDVTLTIGPGRLPSSWSCVHVGNVRRALYGRPDVAARLGDSPVDARALREIPFISPVLYSSGQFVPLDDGCPLGLGDRVIGHEVATVGQGLELARVTGQLVFGPALAARHFVDQGTLVEIGVQGWSSSDPLYVACNMDRVLARVQDTLVHVVREQLGRLQGEDAPPVRALGT